MEYSKILNIGILAHVDAGKTTLTEHLLYHAGAIRSIGSVDKGSAVTDNLTLEKKRGISIKAATTSFVWKNTKVNLIDTPGHVDFSSEVARTLCVVDAVVLVVSAVEGVQAHTLTIVDALHKLNIPTLIFINKIDRQGADTEIVLKQIKSELQFKTVAIYTSHDEGLPSAHINPVFNNSTVNKEGIIEELIETDENLLTQYLNGVHLSDEVYLKTITKNTSKAIISPVFTGIAKNNIGVEELLNGIIQFIEPNKISDTKETSAYVYKLEHHKIHGAMAHVKVFSGELSSKSAIYNHTQDLETKINQSKTFYQTKHIDTNIKSGDIGIVTGVLGTKAGDILGTSKGIPKLPQLNIPVLSVQVIAINDKDYNALAQALQIIDKEDPSLQFKWHKPEKELILLLMGDMQIEVLTHLLQERFNIDVRFTEPQIVYKETISKAAEGYIRYWMPKPCWAIMTFLIEPAPLNSGVTYQSIVSKNDVHNKYQNEIARTIPKALEQGLLGWEVTDVKITLIKGEDHNVHSRPGDFNLATPMGIMKGLQNGGTHLLEPLLRFEIKTNEELLGKLISELTNRRASIETPMFQQDLVSLTGTIPVATSLDLSIKLNAICSGRLRLRMVFHEYTVCPEGEGKSKEFKGVNPLDEAQWILHRRGAYKADERVI
ncbi:TetM/TetW/TetO/TetS family tetracycline resistance ribosomal protection protein [Tenacibaculum sp. S7007]|uniref:Tetracycline resistance protein TetQ n=1 Tax=Tenacibaculum pelagium TaxID=2759527 RepID=A0A839AS30_9FLAO|nr:TetM/TetW/TetO/TetS family tetracycline resistance ribosomal protection protein [Tenacibaculum pelagium]MBA6156451.1 TetM/TetW/TetO/TetS family tetracycline resistance ribosomal protection protein [Tenacibaculum pelagium]